MRLIDADPIIEILKRARKDVDSPRRDLDLLCLQELLEFAPEITPPPNDPLTLEELLEMNGDPVWTVTLSVDGSGRWELCTCEVVTTCPLHKVLRCVTAVGDVTDYKLDTYGKTWLAYRRKPEEGTA